MSIQAIPDIKGASKLKLECGGVWENLAYKGGKVQLPNFSFLISRRLKPNMNSNHESLKKTSSNSFLVKDRTPVDVVMKEDQWREGIVYHRFRGQLPTQSHSRLTHYVLVK